MHVIRKYSSDVKLKGKPEGRRILIIPETLAEVVGLFNWCEDNGITKKFTIAADTVEAKGDENIIAMDMASYINNKQIPVLRFISTEDLPYENYVELAGRIAPESTTEPKHRINTKFGYSEEVLRHEWKA